MKEIIGTSTRILEVDLTRSKAEIYEVKPGERRLYLGGKGLGLKLLHDRLRPGADPLGEQNMIAFMRKPCKSAGRKRGDDQNGIPTPRTLERLGIQRPTGLQIPS